MVRGPDSGRTIDRDAAAPPTATRRSTLKASGLAALGIASLTLPRPSAAASLGGTGSNSNPDALLVAAEQGSCGFTTTTSSETTTYQHFFTIQVYLDVALVPAASDIRVSLDGDLGGPWLTATSGPSQFDNIVYWVYRIEEETLAPDDAGCNDPYARLLRGEVEDDDGVVLRPDLLVGRFVDGSLVATYEINDWEGNF